MIYGYARVSTKGKLVMETVWKLKPPFLPKQERKRYTVTRTQEQLQSARNLISSKILLFMVTSSLLRSWTDLPEQ